MGYDANPNDSDLTIVTDVLQYSVFATHAFSHRTPIPIVLFIFLCRSKKPLNDDTISPDSIEPSVPAVDANFSEAVFCK